MIIIEKDMIIFDLMKEVPKDFMVEYSQNWRKMNKDFFIQFLEKLNKLETSSINIEIPREKIEEIIIKDFYGRDIFSFFINNENLVITIEQYEEYWNAIYTISNEKLILFTM